MERGSTRATETSFAPVDFWPWTGRSVFPGIGDFYMGHRKLAALEFVGVAFFWVALFLPDPEYPMTVLGAVLVAAVIVVFLHVPDAVGTWCLARNRKYAEKFTHAGSVAPSCTFRATFGPLSRGDP